MTTAPLAREARIPRMDALEAAGVAALSGAIAGILVGGIGARIAMRIAGAMSDPALVGVAKTDNGNVVGDITVGGTFALAIFAGLIPGLIGGALFAVLRPWLAPLGRWAGLVFGLALLAIVGSAVLAPFNIDFRRFGAPPVNVAIFALLFPLFGIALGIAVPRIERRVREARPLSPWPVAALLALVPLALMLLLAVVSSIQVLMSGDSFDPRPLILICLLIVPIGARLLLGRDRPFDDARDLPRSVRVLTYAPLILLLVIGAPSTIEAVLFLARP